MAVLSGTRTIRDYQTNVTVASGAKITVAYGGNLNNSLVSSGATVTIASGGYAEAVRINKGAKITVNAGAYDNYAFVYGEEIVRGAANNGTIYAGGKQTVYAGGSAYSVNVYGTQIVSGGSADATIYKGGVQRVYGGVASAYVEKGGVQIVYSAGQITGGYTCGSQILSGGSAWSFTVSSGGTQIIRNGGVASQCHVERGATQLVSAGASSFDHSMWGRQLVYTGAVVSQVSMFGVQILSGGKAFNDYVASGASQYIRKGGVAEGESIVKGAVQIISAQGTANNCYVEGTQTIYTGGKAINACVQSGGRQTVAKGGVASNIEVYSGGALVVQAGGKIIGGYLNGDAVATIGGVASGVQVAQYNGGYNQTKVTMTVTKGGVASNTYVGSGGALVVQAGGKIIGGSLGGNAVATIAGVASGVQVGQNNGGYNQTWATMTVKKGGVARNTQVFDKLAVAAGGVASATTVNNGGHLSVAKGATARNVDLYGGKLTVAAGASVVNVSAHHATYGGMAENQLNFGKNVTINGVNKWAYTKVTAGGALTVKTGATLSLTGDTRLQSFALNVGGATLNVVGSQNRVLTLAKANSRTTLNFDLHKDSLTTSRLEVKPELLDPGYKRNGPMLNVGYEQSFAGKVTVSVNGLQLMREYELSDGINFAKNAVTLKMNGSTLGTLKTGGTLKKNGVSYQLAKSHAGQYRLTMTAIAGVMRKGTAKNDTLVGGANCDIFYGGAGNDTFKGVNGHDVVFYDTKKWGKDTIAATNGSVTLYMAGLDSGYVTTTQKGKDLVITRNGIAGDSITIRNYNENKHNIIYGGTKGMFSKYLNAAKPSASVQNEAREALWKKTGLLANA